MKIISLCLFLLLSMILLSGCAIYSHETDLAGIISYANDKRPPEQYLIFEYNELWYRGEEDGYQYFMYQYGTAGPFSWYWYKKMFRKLFKVHLRAEDDFKSLGMTRNDVFPLTDDSSKWRKVKSIEIKKNFE